MRTQADPEDPRVYRILEQIGADEGVTQRELSTSLGIALGVTNSFIRRLVRKGHLKVTTLPRNRLKYFLTPSGLALKTRLSYEYIRNSLAFYQQARLRTGACVDRLVGAGKTRLAFYGRGDLAEIAHLTLQEKRLPFVALFDDTLAGQDFFGHAILPESGIPEVPHDALLYTKPNWPGDAPYHGPLGVVHIFDGDRP